MQPTGIIFAVLDCDADSIVAFNRWYDLEHVPPNIALPGVILGHRYAAPPELHALRVTDASSGFANQRGTFLTIYTLCEPPAETVATMSTVRDRLYAANRMTFPAEKKIVRDGDAMSFMSGVSASALMLPPEEVPFVGHTAMLVVQRRIDAATSAWYRDDWAPRVVALAGVHGVATFRSGRADDVETDLVFFEGDAAAQTRAIRSAAPAHPAAQILADAPFLLIHPLVYPWADAIAQSDLPKTIG